MKEPIYGSVRPFGGFRQPLRLRGSSHYDLKQRSLLFHFFVNLCVIKPHDPYICNNQILSPQLMELFLGNHHFQDTVLWTLL